MPNVESHLDTVGGARYITVCDVQNAYHQIPVAESEQDKTAFVTQNGNWVFKRLPFGVANAPFLSSRNMSLAFAHFGPKVGSWYIWTTVYLVHLPGQATYSC